MAKNIRGFLKNLFKYYFLNIIVDVNFFGDLKFKYYCEYYPKILLQVSLKWETKIDGKGHEIFSEKNYWAMKYLGLRSLGPRNLFWKICKNPLAPLCSLPKLLPLIRTCIFETSPHFERLCLCLGIFPLFILNSKIFEARY